MCIRDRSLADYEVHRITVGVYYRMDLGGSTFSAVCPISLETPFFCTRAVPVSYTHLDVYKRQEIDHLRVYFEFGFMMYGSLK